MARVASKVALAFGILAATATQSGDAAGARRQQQIRHSEDTPPYIIPDFCLPAAPCTLMMVADMDSSNRRDSGKSIKFESRLMTLKITSKRPKAGTRGAAAGVLPEVQVVPGAEEKFSTLYNEGGRGGEFSDLTPWRQRLYTADDRTGIIFQFGGSKEKRLLLPRHIFAEGDGESSAKGKKIEWMTTKDGDLYVGSFGKPYITSKGVYVNRAQEWVVKIDPSGRASRLDWGANFRLMRKVVGALEPGYLTHEAIRYSQNLEMWVALPRKFSTEAYDDEADEHRGSNLMIFCTKDFSKCFARRAQLKGHRAELGFSAFDFVPGTKDLVIAATFSEEVGDLQRTYFCVIDIWGRPLLDVTQMPTDVKYEGLAFVKGKGVQTPMSFEGVGV